MKKNNGFILKARTRKKGKSQFDYVVERIAKNPNAVIGLTIILLLVLMAIFADVISPYSYMEMNSLEIKQGPSAAHWFGTDDLGRDIFTRIAYGTRYSLSLGFISTTIGFIMAIIIGSIAGYFGGWVDNLLMRVLDIFSSIPAILICVLLSAVLGSGFMNTVIALAMCSVSGMARLLRAQVMSLRDKEFVEAAVATNCTNVRIMFSHILPNAISPLIVNATGMMASSLLFAAMLSFIGLGIQPPTPEWGAMLAGARSYIRTYPHMLIFPGLFICVTIIGLNIFGDALRDAMDPKLKN